MPRKTLIKALDGLNDVEEVVAELRKEHGIRAASVAQFRASQAEQEENPAELDHWQKVLLLLEKTAENLADIK